MHNFGSLVKHLNVFKRETFCIIISYVDIDKKILKQTKVFKC